MLTRSLTFAFALLLAAGLAATAEARGKRSVPHGTAAAQDSAAAATTAAAKLPEGYVVARKGKR
jgi:hypothetical protein